VIIYFQGTDLEEGLWGLKPLHIWTLLDEDCKKLSERSRILEKES